MDSVEQVRQLQEEKEKRHAIAVYIQRKERLMGHPRPMGVLDGILYDMHAMQFIPVSLLHSTTLDINTSS
jgi:predicted RNA-binding protein (virulence factor B family)